MLFTLDLVLSGGKLSNSAVLCGVATFTGVQILAVGVVAVYLAKILDETRARPTYVVAKKLAADLCRKTMMPLPGVPLTALTKLWCQANSRKWRCQSAASQYLAVLSVVSMLLLLDVGLCTICGAFRIAGIFFQLSFFPGRT